MTTPCLTCGLPVSDYHSGVRYADTAGGHADRHTLVLEAAERATGETCDECAEPIDADDLAPSCGVHRLHLGCRAHFSCRWCDEEWKEANG